jgi:hypothetical protein
MTGRHRRGLGRDSPEGLTSMATGILGRQREICDGGPIDRGFASPDGTAQGDRRGSGGMRATGHRLCVVDVLLFI